MCVFGFGFLVRFLLLSGFSALVCVAFGVSGCVGASGRLVVRVPVSGSGLRWFQVGPGGRWFVSAS